MDLLNDLPREWLETDGLGGFATGTEPGCRTRRYHALLCTPLRPPLGRTVLVNGLEVWLEGPGGVELLSTQIYDPGVVNPDGYRRVESFTSEPWPRWTYRLCDGSAVAHDLFMPRGRSLIALRWSSDDTAKKRTLCVRPLLSGRDYHHLHAQNEFFRFDAEVSGNSVRWRPYPELPSIRAISTGRYTHAPQWYYKFLYVEERRRGLDSVEDLGSPGVFRFDLTEGDAILLLSAGDGEQGGGGTSAVERFDALEDAERRRRSAFPSPLHRAADAYLVKRGRGLSVVAGYPWFSDWGRDAFVAVRGLCLATGRLAEARDILLAWSGVVSQGMLPNRFTDSGDAPEFNSVDASLWYVIAAGEFLKRCESTSSRGRESSGRRKTPSSDSEARALGSSMLDPKDREAIEAAIEAILDGYAGGTRYGIRLEHDGLIAAGEPGSQLTWMDVKIDEWVATPRVGKPVEVQALWLNALRMSPRFEEKWATAFRRGLAAFSTRFWNPHGGYLYDVVDVDHQEGTASADFRPNQLFAVGGLPESVLPLPLAEKVIAAAEERLWTPFGPRTLSPNHPDYRGRCIGGVWERDAAYHQGTIWPWLAGAFIEGWVRVRGGSAESKREARTRFLEPLLAQTETLGVGHLPELADGDPPHLPRGCPFQAWSVSEALRLSLEVLAVDDEKRS
ncbi:MAG: amylo-alpha-1,6-glucosidase [Planctomycetota bacterium]|nr:amylo-alpha-1,6-glucosidase [Planctomycetota bacterium]